MAENTDRKTFQYNISATKKLLPTDYSIQEMAKFRKINHQTLHSYIWNTKALEDFYAALPVNYIPGERDNKRGVNPIPLEVEPYFYNFANAAMTANYSIRSFLKDSEEEQKQTNRKKELIFSENDKVKIASDFGKKLLEELYHYARSDQNAPPFFKNALFENDTFCDAAASALWEDEFRKRCDLLLQLVRQCSVKNRFLDLAHIIYFLDVEIGAFSSLASQENRDEETAYREFLTVFPKQLFQKAREPIIPKSAQEKPCYILEDKEIQLSSRSYPLSEAFPIIENKSNEVWKDLRTAARNLYEDSLQRIFPASEFQEQFESLAEYLERIRKPYPEDFVRNVAENVSISFYQPILQYIGLCQHTACLEHKINKNVQDPCYRFLNAYAERFSTGFIAETRMESISLSNPAQRQAYFSDITILPSEPLPQSAPSALVSLCEKYLGRLSIWCWDSIFVEDEHTTVHSIFSVLLNGYEIACSQLLLSPTGVISLSALEQEWDAIQLKFFDRIFDYLSGKSPDFPFPGTMLHEILFAMKIHGYYHQDARQFVSIFQQFQNNIQLKFGQ